MKTAFAVRQEGSIISMNHIDFLHSFCTGLVLGLVTEWWCTKYSLGRSTYMDFYTSSIYMIVTIYVIRSS